MACYSTVGATIKREHTDRSYSSQQFVHPSSQVLHKELKRELSPAPSPPTIQVCPINVVQGDSILVKLKYKEGMFNPNLMPMTVNRHLLVNKSNIGQHFTA